MTVNLLKQIHEKIDDRLVGQIGTVLGENEGRTRAGIDAAVPTLLRGVMGVAATEQGAQMVERELDPFDDGIIHEYGKQLEFDKSRPLVESGSDLVQAFFGNATIRTLAIVSRESGLGASKCRALTGLLMPLVLGVVGEQRMKRNLDTAGFRRLLDGQTDYIARKIPEGVCAALNLPKLEKRPFYPPQHTKATLSPYQPSASAGPGLAATDLSNLQNTPRAETDNVTAPLPSTMDRRQTGPNRPSSTQPIEEGGKGWIWGVALPLVLLLGLLGWLFSRSRSAPPNEQSTSQTIHPNRSKIADLPSWDLASPTADIDSKAMLKEEFPTIAPSFNDDDFDDDDFDEGDFDEDEKEQETKEHNADVSPETAPEVSGENEETSHPTDTARKDASAVKENTSANGRRQSIDPPNSFPETQALLRASQPSTDGPTESKKLISQSREPPPKTTPNSKSRTEVSAEPRALSERERTVATALSRPNSSLSDVPDRATVESSDTPLVTPSPNTQSPAAAASLDNVSIPPTTPIATTVDPATLFANRSMQKGNGKSVHPLATELSRIAIDVSDALGEIDGVDDARKAVKAIQLLSDDLYKLAPRFKGVNSELRSELNKRTHAFASQVEILLNEQIDVQDEKSVLLPTLIVLMQRLESSLER